MKRKHATGKWQQRAERSSSQPCKAHFLFSPLQTVFRANVFLTANSPHLTALMVKFNDINWNSESKPSL